MVGTDDIKSEKKIPSIFSPLRAEREYYNIAQKLDLR
jgi:hypothetical protein